MDHRYRVILILLAALNFTHILDFMIIMPLGNYLMPYLKISTQQFSFLVSAYAFSAGLTSIVSAFFVNDYNRKHILLFAFVGFLVGTLACALAPTYLFLLFARIVAGLFGGMIGAQVTSIVADLIPFEHRGKAMGMVMSGFALASTIGVPLALYFANAFTWHAPFLFIVAFGSILIPFLFKYIPDLKDHIGKDTVKAEMVINTILKDRVQLQALIFTGLMMLGHFMIIPFINPFLEYNKGFSKSITPQVYLFGGLAAFASSYIAGKLADQYGKWKVYTIAVLLTMPLMIFITNLPITSISLTIGVFALWFAVATARGVSAQALVSNVASPQLRGSFQSFNSFFQQMGSGLAALIAGFTIGKTQDGSLTNFPLLGIYCILFLGITLVIGKQIFNNKV